MGGLGKYSHGKFCLPHQHHVEQVISSGGFNVHDTEASEAVHKLCMRLPAQRVKHGRPNTTKSSMLAYWCRHTLFQALLETKCTQPPPTTIKVHLSQVQVPLLLSGSTNVAYYSPMGVNLADITVQQQFLHPEVRLTRVEMMDLLCDTLSMPKTRISYQKMETLVWTLGQHLVLPGGTTYWATDSNYKYVKSEHSRHRRDIFLLRGVEHIQVTQPNGHVFRRPTALCCEGICFFTIHNILDLDHTLPRNVVNLMEGSKYTCGHMRNYMWTHANLHVHTCTPTCGHMHTCTQMNTSTNELHTYFQVI